MTVFVGCPEGCRYHTASAVYDLVFDILHFPGKISKYDPGGKIWSSMKKNSIFTPESPLSDQSNPNNIINYMGHTYVVDYFPHQPIPFIPRQQFPIFSIWNKS